MCCTACQVIPIRGHWKVVRGDAIQATYMDETTALRVATNEALAIRRNGQQARVSVYDECGEVHAEYCLCLLFNQYKKG